MRTGGGGVLVSARSAIEEEFRDFVAARSAALLRTAYLLAGDWATAEDLLQTALTKTYLAWRRLGEIEAVEPYARRVLINTATSWWRRRWHGERPTEVMPERAGPDQIEEQLNRDALWRHVKALPARQRAVLVLRFYEDLSEAQTAALLNISVGTVKSQTSRALNALRQRLGAEDDLLARRATKATADPVAGPPPAVPSPRAAKPARTVRTPAADDPATPAPAADPAGSEAGTPASQAGALVGPAAPDAGPREGVRRVPAPRVPAPRNGVSRPPVRMPVPPGGAIPAVGVEGRPA
jgi:RNA polymerase sigma-70 factor (ECF subfamily)